MTHAWGSKILLRTGGDKSQEEHNIGDGEGTDARRGCLFIRVRFCIIDSLLDTRKQEERGPDLRTTTTTVWQLASAHVPVKKDRFPMEYDRMPGVLTGLSLSLSHRCGIYISFLILTAAK